MRHDALMVCLLVASTGACFSEEPNVASGSALGRALPAHSDVRAFPNAWGEEETLHTRGVEDENPFFDAIGTNGRSCVTCHDPAQGWSVHPSAIEQTFSSSHGGDPLFAPVDGAGAPDLARDTLEQRRAASALLLRNGLFAVRVALPERRDFELSSVADPYGNTLRDGPTVFRRPIPTTNVAYLSSVMWDGREQTGSGLDERLSHQAEHATQGHAQGTRELFSIEREFIVRFEKNNFSAQSKDNLAGKLDEDGARGGSAELWRQPHYAGVNAVSGDARTGRPFNPKVFDLYDAWKDAETRDRSERGRARAQIYRGQELFNSRTFDISRVAGVTDRPELARFARSDPPPGSADPASRTLVVTCSVCHNAPNVGSHSTELFADTGVASAARRPSDVPLYGFKNPVTGEHVETTDPGRALVTGKFADIGKFKVPVLRALASRPPYFHDGSAKELTDVVEFYDSRFALGLSAAEKADLAAFLRAL